MTSTDTRANVTHESGMPQERGLTVLSEPRAVALVWLGTYLALSGIVLSVGGHGWLGALHATGVILIAWSMTSAGLPRALGDLLPLFVAPLLYGEIPFLIAAFGTSYHDAMVQRWELAIFGAQPSRTLAGSVPAPFVSEVLHLGYLAYYPAIFAPPLLLYARREARGFAETVLALTMIYTVCWVFFVLMPVEGPRYLWSAPSGIPDGPLRRLAVGILAAGSSRGAAFPSSHMAVMVGQAVMAFRWQRRIGWLLVVVSVLVGVGAVYGGFHYGIDMLAGAAVGAACAVATVAVAGRSPRRVTRESGGMVNTVKKI